MKLNLIFPMILLLTVGAIACSGVPETQKESGNSIEGNSAVSQVVLEVPTISCSTCQSRVAASAKSVPGVKAVEFDGQTVTITYNPEQTTPDAIVEAIEGRGDRVAKVTKL